MIVTRKASKTAKFKFVLNNTLVQNLSLYKNILPKYCRYDLVKMSATDSSFVILTKVIFNPNSTGILYISHCCQFLAKCLKGQSHEKVCEIMT
jgi:hypothetical protein